jgi:hypothetical protein
MLIIILTLTIRKFEKIVKIQEDNKDYDMNKTIISKLEELSNILNFVKISIQKWRETLIKRFHENFSFLNETFSQNLNLANFFEISKSLKNIVHSEINKCLGIEKTESMKRETPLNSMYSSTAITNLFNRSLSSTTNKKKTLKNVKSLNYKYFEIFLMSIDFNPSELKIKDVINKNDQSPINFKNIRNNFKTVKNDKQLFISLVQFKVYLKNEIKNFQERKTNEVNLFNSDLFSQNRTLSIKRNSSRKDHTIESINLKNNTEKRYYENHNLENIEIKNSQRPLKLVKTSQKNFLRDDTHNSISSINSKELHVKDFEQKNLIKSHFSNDVIDNPGQAIMPNNRKKTGNWLSPTNNKNIKSNNKNLKLINPKKINLMKSYHSNQFSKLKSPRKKMLLSQKFGKFMVSARSLISQDSAMFNQYTTSIVPKDELRESLGVTEHKRLHRKKAMDRSQSKCARISVINDDRKMNRDSSIGFGFNMMSRDILSVDKSISKSSNPFLLTSELFGTQKVIDTEKSRKHSMKNFRIGGLEKQKSLVYNKINESKLINSKINSSIKIHNRNIKGKKMKTSGGHQKFASVNLDYLRLKTSKTDINGLKSEISNMMEEDPKYHIKKKKKRTKNKNKAKASDKLLVMKSLVTRGLNTNYSKILASGLVKTKTSKKKKPRNKKKKLNFQTLQSNINNLNYFNTNTFKSKAKPKKISTRNKSITNKHSRRTVKNTSLLKKKLEKDISIGNIPSLRIFPKQIKLKNDIKHIIAPKQKSKKALKQVSKLKTEEGRKSEIYSKPLNGSSSTKFKNNLKMRKKNIHQKMKKFSAIIGKIKKPRGNISREKSYNQKLFKAKPQNQDFFKSKRKSEIAGYPFDSNFNNKISEKYLLNSGEGKKKKKKTTKNKNKLGHFFSYLGYAGDGLNKKVKKKQHKKLKNALHEFSRKL